MKKQFVEQDNHNYGDINGVRTEWSILQEKYGNIAPRPKTPPKEDAPTHDEFNSAMKELILTHTKDDVLKDLEEDTQDDDEFKIIQEIRKKRLMELRKNAALQKFGTVREISGDSYVKEVTEASKDLWVVCHLYASGKPECKQLDEAMRSLASEKMTTKFCRIQGNLAIKKFPEALCPTIVIYNKGQLIANWNGLKYVGGSRTNSKSLEWALKKIGAVDSALQSDPLLADEDEDHFHDRKTSSINFVYKQRYLDGEDFED